MATKVAHCKRHDTTKYIGRGSPWGNLFTHLPLNQTKAEFQSPTRDAAIADFENWLIHSSDARAKWMRDNIDELKGHILGCYCHPLSCHGDVLAKYADMEPIERPWIQDAVAE